MKNNNLFLIADIGGTHIRQALVEKISSNNQTLFKLYDIDVKKCRDFPNPIAALKTYEPFKNANKKAICLAIASPIDEDELSDDEEVFLTNNHWQFNRQQVAEQMGVDNVFIVNDFFAQAMAIPFIPKKCIIPAGPNKKVVNPYSPRAVIGPGTGLGCAILLDQHESEQKWKVFPAEGGHVDFAPRTEQDVAVVNFLKEHENFERISAENLLSGKGIERIYRAHKWNKTKKIEHIQDKIIVKKALEDDDALCKKVLYHFCEILGAHAGNVALTIGAKAGVYISGGLIPRFREIFHTSNFRKAFEDKVPNENYMSQIPTFAVYADHPGLHGAAATLDYYYLRLNAKKQKTALPVG